MFGFGNQIVQEDLERIYLSNISWDIFNEKTVLVTGANAMLGTYTAYFFLFLAKEKNISVKTVVLTRTLSKTEILYKDFLGENYFDIINQDIVMPIHYGGSVDYIFHFAGNASPKFINTDPVGILKSNLIGTMNVLELAKEKQSSRLLFASTREVYGAVSATSLTETSFGYLDPMENRSCYPESKRAAEALCQAYRAQKDVDVVIARLSRVYGPTLLADDSKALSQFIKKAVHSEDIVLKSEGNQYFSYAYVADAVSALLYLFLLGENGEAYNIATDDIYELECNMKKYLYSLALTKYKETEYMQYYDIYNHTSNDWKKCRRESNELLEYLYFQEENLNKEFELYRRGSKSFRQEEENKWLKNVVKARLC